MKHILNIALTLLCLSAFSQTPNPSDSATAWNVQFNYSTNQKTALVFIYKDYTNGLPVTVTNIVGTNIVVTTNAIPSLTDWHRDQRKAAAGRTADDYIRQRQDALNAQQAITQIRQLLPDATEAQINQIKAILGIP